jgi:hypothetical protein
MRKEKLEVIPVTITAGGSVRRPHSSTISLNNIWSSNTTEPVHNSALIQD